MVAPYTGPNVGTDRNRQFKAGLLVVLLVLVVQFMLGMAVNLFVKIPDHHPGSNPPEYFTGVAQSVAWAITQGHILLALHAGLGLLLVIASAGVLVRAIQSRRRGLIISTVLGFIGVLGAGFNGGSYLNYHADVSSMLMSTGFAIAVTSYVVALYLVSREPLPAGSLRSLA
jgi:hypothetical protein